MRRFIFTTFLAALVCFPFITKAQTTLIEENFDAYANGAKLAQAAQAAGNNYWTTWSGTVGGDEDGTIVNTQQHSAANSAKIIADNDVVLKLGDKTTGSYEVSFYAFIPTGRSGYFNFLHIFAGAGSEHAVEIYFNAGGSITLKANTDITGTYPVNTWFPVVATFDLDADQATISFNGTLLHTWKWSLKPGGSSGTKKLAAMDLFGHEPECELYVDDILYKETTPPKPAPTLAVDSTSITKKIGTNTSSSTNFKLTSTVEGTATAEWSTYLKFPSQTTGTQQNFSLVICDENNINNEGGIGGDSDVIRELGMKLAPSNYNTKLGGKIEKVEFFINASYQPTTDLTFRVYAQGASSFVTGEILAEKVLTMANFSIGQWNAVTLDTPVELTGGDVWVTVEMGQAAGEYPLTTDGGPWVAGGDWIRTNGGSWSPLHENNPTLSYNFAIRASGKGLLNNIWVQTDKVYGTTEALESTMFTLTFNSGSYPDGNYNATVIINSNSETTPLIEIPVTMIVDSYTASEDTTIQGIKVNGNNALYKPALGQYVITIDCPGSRTIDIEVVTTHPKATVAGAGEQPVICGQNNEFTLVVTAEDGVHTATYKLVVSVKKGDDAISELDNLIRIYPNPANDILRFEADIQVNHVAIYDLQGRLVKDIHQLSQTINIEDLANGIYFIKAMTPQGEIIRKIVKQ